MFIVSRKSADKMFHDQNCRYALMISPHNRVYYHTMAEAFSDGKIACSYCAALMKMILKEIDDLRGICEENGIGIVFNHEDGTLEIQTEKSEWKLAPYGSKHRLRLYHKNKIEVPGEATPYEGYHLQKAWGKTIRDYLEYIVNHEYYKQELREQRKLRKKYHNIYRDDGWIQPSRNIKKIRSTKRHHTARDYKKMQNGTYDWK